MFFRRRPTLPAELSDEELLLRYRQYGDVQDLGVLYERHLTAVFAICRRYLRPDEDAQDAVMQLFEQLVDKLQKHEVGNFTAWLHTTVRNHCLMVLRARQRTSPDGGPLILHFPDATDMESAASRHLPSDDPDEAASTEARLRHLEHALTELPDGQRQCLEMFYLQQKCYRDIADATGYELSLVKSYLQNGKRNLKRMLESYPTDAAS
ncbi:sigma-70 family RNA polymerase sigma factor [Hymenobacter lutimineralis]|uniref:Sigma-70 family RNA polymerase sigma factor n=1 Tax=Hymenobacter lutimineralis TaxID=2606448 RepID=A0A5D6V9B5_9BACT|nr:sigma-70 family RNA polymerase sigma factor [Hymenobacter lutimineralis]TYZ11419.1 sigma-70 family RNA polymerase sigma factor [Hymenobacter lutimineralis]